MKTIDNNEENDHDGTNDDTYTQSGYDTVSEIDEEEIFPAELEEEETQSSLRRISTLLLNRTKKVIMVTFRNIRKSNKSIYWNIY